MHAAPTYHLLGAFWGTAGDPKRWGNKTSQRNEWGMVSLGSVVQWLLPLKPDSAHDQMNEWLLGSRRWEHGELALALAAGDLW